MERASSERPVRWAERIEIQFGLLSSFALASLALGELLFGPLKYGFVFSFVAPSSVIGLVWWGGAVFGILAVPMGAWNLVRAVHREREVAPRLAELAWFLFLCAGWALFARLL